MNPDTKETTQALKKLTFFLNFLDIKTQYYLFCFYEKYSLLHTLNLLYISILNKKLGGINVSCRYLDNCHRNSRSPSKPEEVMAQWYLPIRALNTIMFIFIFDNFRIGRYHLYNRIKSLYLQYHNSIVNVCCNQGLKSVEPNTDKHECGGCRRRDIQMPRRGRHSIQEGHIITYSII